MAGSMLSLFASFTTILLASTLAFFIYIIVRQSDQEEYTTSLMFLGLVSMAVMLSALFYLMGVYFGLETFMGIDTRTAIPLMMLLAVIAVQGVVWQVKEYAEIAIN